MATVGPVGLVAISASTPSLFFSVSMLCAVLRPTLLKLLLANMQDAYCSSTRNRHGFNHCRHLATWLCSSCRNHQ